MLRYVKEKKLNENGLVEDLYLNSLLQTVMEQIPVCTSEFRGFLPTFKLKNKM